jgi:Tn3 transposase DDE domain
VVRGTELLAEVDQWTSLGDRFLHLRTQAPPKNLTAILADGINLGLTRLSEACRETTWRQLSWTADWHVREQCWPPVLKPATFAYPDFLTLSTSWPLEKRLPKDIANHRKRC